MPPTFRFPAASAGPEPATAPAASLPPDPPALITAPSGASPATRDASGVEAL